jgi:methylmalonyl-CoA/ethylmalonyl-CoA epimerase
VILDHIAIVVADLEAALKLYTETLGFRIIYRELVADQSVEAVGLDGGGAVIELLRPLSDDSPVARYRGDAASKLHHAAYRVDDLQAELDRLKGAGIRLIDQRPRKGAHGNQVAFIHPSATEGVLTELCEAPKERA